MAVKSPSKRAVKRARLAAVLTQAEAAADVRVALRTWQQWEAGDRTMPAGLWELFQLKRYLRGVHPYDKIEIAQFMKHIKAL